MANTKKVELTLSEIDLLLEAEAIDCQLREWNRWFREEPDRFASTQSKADSISSATAKLLRAAGRPILR